jgi:hypothetical protein
MRTLAWLLTEALEGNCGLFAHARSANVKQLSAVKGTSKNSNLHAPLFEANTRLLNAERQLD